MALLLFVQSLGHLEERKFAQTKKEFQKLLIFFAKSKFILALFSCCVAVGSEVATDTRNPRFESSHRPFYLVVHLLLLKNSMPKLMKNAFVDNRQRDQ